MGVIERVAKAIYEAADKQGYVSDYRFHDGDTCLDGNFNLDALARAAIEAMREPTEVMIDAGNALTLPAGHISQSDLDIPATCDRTWQAMIDAALED